MNVSSVGPRLWLRPPVCSPSAKCPQAPAQSLSAASSWTSRRSSRNSLGRAPSLKRRSPSGGAEVLLSGEGRESQDEEEELEEERTSPAGSDRRHRGLGRGKLRAPLTYRTHCAGSPGCTAQPAAAAQPLSTRTATAIRPWDASESGCAPDDPHWMETMVMT